MVFVTEVTLQRAAVVESLLLYGCLEAAGDMIVITAADPDAAGDHPIQYVNRAFEQHTGYSRAEVFGRDARLLQGPDTDRTQVARISQALASWQAVTVELLNYHRSGKPYWVEMTITPVADDRGWFHYWFSVERDITARKTASQNMAASNAELERRVAERTRELQQTVRELEAFSRTVSHDLQNPLHGVRGFAEILQTKYGPVLHDDANRMLALIQRSADQMHAIVEQLLALNRISSMQPRAVDIDVVALCNELIAQITAQAPQHRVHLDIAERLPVRADRQLLQIVLDNLLGNACKFCRSDASVVQIRVEARRLAAGLVLSIADDGIGFDPIEAQTLFTPFQRLRGAKGRPGLGTGLAKAARAADRMGGWIWAEAEPGRGARFHCLLPDEETGVADRLPLAVTSR